jgi:hypothetical protein
MEPKNSKIFRKDIIQAVSAYCETEKIEDIDHFMFLCFKQGFDIKRYGLLGETLNESEKDLIKEVIVEKIVEVPVEVIKEIEKIVEVTKEVIVEKEIIKEVPVEVVKEVEKIVTVTDNEELEEKIIQLNNDSDSERKIFFIKMEEMENNFQNEMSKKDKELDELRLSLDILKKDDKTKLLQETLQSLRKEIQQKNEKIKELETINRDFLGGNQNQAYLLRGSNLKDRI